MLVKLRMSVLAQVKLLTLGFMLILTAEGQNWTVIVPTQINTTWGSDVTINCRFTYPNKERVKNVTVYWKKIGKNIDISDKDKNPFIYHPKAKFVLEKYRKRTQFIGDPNMGNCSLRILNMKENDSDIYVRVDTNISQFSFKGKPISIFVSGAQETQPIDSETQMYVGIFVPVALLVIIITVGIFCFAKHKRSHSFTREESGYYANFSRPSSNQAKSEDTSNNYEKTDLPPPKIIDEPVYVNTQEVTAQMDQSMDLTESVYINIDYSK